MKEGEKTGMSIQSTDFFSSPPGQVGVTKIILLSRQHQINQSDR